MKTERYLREKINFSAIDKDNVQESNIFSFEIDMQFSESRKACDCYWKTHIEKENKLKLVYI